MPQSITAGPDGNLWFTEQGAYDIAEINPTTHAITQFPIPTDKGGVSADGAMTTGPDGNIWFTDGVNGGSIGMINPSTHVITEFTLPTGYSANSLTTGPDGNIWFTDSSAGKIGTINPTTGAIAEYPVPYTGSRPRGITTGPDGNIWFIDAGTNAIGVDIPNSDQFVVTQQPPASVTAGTAFGLTVQADNSSGNLDPSFNGTVTVALQNNPGGATLGGTLTVTASGGVATFSGLTLTKAASGYTLVVSNSSVNSATTSAITVTPAAATQLAITTQPPASVRVNSSFGLQASIEDAYGNVVTTASGSVSVAFASNPTGAKLGGTLTVTASSGVASFTNLTINKTGSGYTLQVSSSGLTSATSNPIKVTGGGYTPTTLLRLRPETRPRISRWPRWCWTARISGTAWDSRSTREGFEHLAGYTRPTEDPRRPASLVIVCEGVREFFLHRILFNAREQKTHESQRSDGSAKWRARNGRGTETTSHAAYVAGAGGTRAAVHDRREQPHRHARRGPDGPAPGNRPGEYEWGRPDDCL